MKTIIKNGFGAYEEINSLAKHVLGLDISVQASIFGDDYVVLNGSLELMRGTTSEIREKLNYLKSNRIAEI